MLKWAGDGRKKKKQSKLCDAHRLRKNTMYCVFFPFCFACMFYSQWTNYHHVLNVWYQPDKDDDDDDDDEVMLSIRVALSAMQYTREIALKTNLHFMVRPTVNCFVTVFVSKDCDRSEDTIIIKKNGMNVEIKSIVSSRVALIDTYIHPLYPNNGMAVQMWKGNGSLTLCMAIMW